MRKLLIAIIGLMCWAGCEYETVVPKVVNLPDEPISFATQIQPIFTAKCITCHSGQTPILTEGKAYNSLVSGGYVDTNNPTNSVVYVKTSGGHPGGANVLSVTEQAYLLKWIEDGASNN